MSDVFIIQEIGAGPATAPAGTFGGEQFVWTADNQAAPEDGWKMPRSQRVVVQHYPGSQRAVHQKLGPRHGTHRMSGMWADRHMGEGVAEATALRFADMVDRGNDVRISCGAWVFVGTIEDYTPDFRDDAEYGYEFTFIPRYQRPGEGPSASAVRASLPGAALLTPTQLGDLASAYVDSMHDLQDGVASFMLTGTLHADVSSSLELIESARGNVTAQVRAGSGLSAQASVAHASLGAAASAHLDVTFALNSGEAVGWDDGSHLLDFEAWRRMSDASAILLVYQSAIAERELRRRSQPNAVRVERPFAGEDIRAFSARHGADWRQVALRNDVAGMTLDGTVALVIPERGG